MNERGVTLIELLIVLFVGSIILLAVGSFFVAMGRFGRHGSDQVFLQRQGTLIQEELTQRILPATSLPLAPCGEASALASLRVAFAGGAMRCFYQPPESSQKKRQIIECELDTSQNPPPCKINTERNLLAGSPIPLQAHNLTFDPQGISVGISFILTEAIQASLADIQSCIIPLVIPPHHMS